MSNPWRWYVRRGARRLYDDRMTGLRTRVAALGPEHGAPPGASGPDRALGDDVRRLLDLNRLLLRYDTAAHHEDLVDDRLWLRGVRQRLHTPTPHRRQRPRHG
jgi:hypothetical protein